jgi:hypothetical protein
MKKLIVMLALTGMSGSLLAETTDSTNVNIAAVKPVIETYLLAQSTEQNVITSTGFVDFAAPITNTCREGTTPILTTSIVRTEQNNVAAIQGLINTLALREGDYHIVGNLYMPNQVVSNSSATASWQIWCQANQTA